MADSPLRIELVKDPARSDAARALITEYVRWVADLARGLYGLDFDADAMIAADVGADSPFRAPGGRLLLVAADAGYVGVGGVKLASDGCAELLRMYVRPEARRSGAGRMLLCALIDAAASLGAMCIRLESLKALHAAHSLYRSVGFVEVSAYDAHSMAEFQPREDLDRFADCVVFMEMRLR